MLRFHRADYYDDIEDGSSDNDREDKMVNSHHPLSVSRNPHNKIIVKLPGSRGIEVEDIFFEWTSMEWRRTMKLPPKQSDLWRIANKLQLFGEEWDEDEQKAISQANAQLIRSLPLPVDQVSAEEQLMLLGKASTAEEAALILSGGRQPSQQEVGQLYTAPDPEEDERAARAIEEMADAMQQLQDAVAAGPTDPSILKVINQSKAFFERGVQPTRGLDEVDKLLMRKNTLMQNCGNRTDHWASRDGVSKQMLCAVRIHLLNESDLDVVCPAQAGAFWTDEDKRCEGGGFNWTRPISSENENRTLTAIKETLELLLKSFPSSAEEDRALLEEGESKDFGPIRRAAILVRARERRILEGSINGLDTRLASLGNLSYQITEVREAEARRLAEIERRRRFKEDALREFLAREVVVEVEVRLSDDDDEENEGDEDVETINLDGDGDDSSGGDGSGDDEQVDAAPSTATFTVREGDNLELSARDFVKAHGLDYSRVEGIVREARRNIQTGPPTRQIIFIHPVILANGSRVLLRLRQQDNGTQEVLKFCAVHNMTDRYCDWMRSELAPYVERHFQEGVIATAVLNAPDGRQLQAFLREGEQHDLEAWAADFATAARMPSSVVPSLAMMLERKLQPVIFEQAISGEGRIGIKLKLRRGENSEKVVSAFGHKRGVDPGAQAQILAALKSRGF